MTVNPYKHAIEIGLSGTDADVPVLNALTSEPISVADVLQFFDEQNLAEMDPIENAWVGTLVDLVKNPATPGPVVVGLRKLFNHLAKRTSQTVDTTNPVFAVETWTLLSVLIQMGVVTTQQRDAFYALDGGRPYADLKVEQYALEKAAYEADQALAAATALRTAKINQWRNRVTSAVSEWDAGHVTEAAAELTSVAAEMGQ